MTPDEHVSAESVLAALAGRAEADDEAAWAHLNVCSSCRAGAQEWSRMREALSSWSWSLPAPRPLAVPALTCRPARPAVTASAWHAMTVVAAQVPVVRRQVWAATAIVAAIGCLVVAVTGAAAGTVLTLTAPVTAALGLAVIYGPDSDPCAEVSACCPVSPRTVLLARLAVVAGYDLAVALCATLLLAGTGTGSGVRALITAWLGPLLAMAGLSVLLSVLFRPWAGVMAALFLWTLRVLTLSPARPAVLAVFTGWLWSTTPVTAAVAACALVVAIFTAGRRENRLDRRPLQA
jgi:hypothetical protein